MKHRGGSGKGPSHLSAVKRWCVLTDLHFFYCDTAAVAQEKHIRRCLRLEEISGVNALAVTDEEKAAGQKRSLRLLTGSRSYYFTADSERDLSDWMDMFASARTGLEEFARFATASAKDSFAGQVFPVSSRTSPTHTPHGSFHNAPEGLAEKESIFNPVYRASVGKGPTTGRRLQIRTTIMTSPPCRCGSGPLPKPHHLLVGRHRGCGH